MAYPADAFGGGVQGCWLDAQVITNFKRDTVTLSDYNGTSGRFYDQWIDKSGNGNDLTSSNVDFDGMAYNVGGFKFGWHWIASTHAQGASSTGIYIAIAHETATDTSYYSRLWSDVAGDNTGFKLEYNGDDAQYVWSAGTGSARVNCAIASGGANYAYESGKKLIECWWTAALGLNIRINKGAVTTVACGSVSAGSSTVKLPGVADGDTGDYYGIYEIHNYLYTKNSVPNSAGRDAIADSFGALAGITLATTGLPTITGIVHARESTVDDDFTANGANARIGFASIYESSPRDTFVARQAIYVGGRSGFAAIVEGGYDRFVAVRQVPDSIDSAFLAWLKSDDKLSTILVEADANTGSGEVQLNLSNNGYTSGAGDTPASYQYDAVITGGGVTNETLPRDGSAALAFGDIEIDNRDGLRDAWLDYVFVGRSCRIYVGDKRWAKSSFRLILDGISNENLVSRAREVLNLTVRDKLQKLNTPVSETKLGGSSANADRLLPLTAGECHNVTPLLIDKTTLTYQFHHDTGGWNNAERVIEVRDNGVPVPCAPLNPGKFVLAYAPYGSITASVQGDSQTYTNTASRLIQRIVKNCSVSPLVDADLDALNLSVFDAANPQAIGLYLSDTANALAVCQEIAASVGGQMVMTATGVLRLLKIQLPAIFTPTAIDLSNIIEGTLEIADRPPVVAAVKIGYCRNWTPQPDLRTAIPVEHKILFSQEWLTVTAKDAAVAANYKLTQEPEQSDTLLITKADADAEAARRLDLWKIQRTVFRYQGTAELLAEQLGGYQTITNRRFGLAAGKTGQIIGIQRDWMNGRVVIDLLV